MKHAAFKTLARTWALGTSCIALMLLAGPASAQGSMVPTDPPDMQATQGLLADTPAASALQTTDQVQAADPTPILSATTSSVPAPASSSTYTMTPAPDMPAPSAAPASSVPAVAQTATHNQDSKIMHLRDVVAVGLSDNPEYGIVANNRRATDEELNQAVDLYFPSIDATSQAGYEHTNNPTTRQSYTDGRSGNMWQYQTGVTLTQLLFDGWETAYENQRQKFRVLSATHRVREASELVGLSIVESYLEVMRQRELLKNARDNVAQHMDILNQIKDSTAAGRTTAADVEQARARVASARAEAAQVREALRVAEAGFIQQTGETPRDLVMPTVPVDQLAANVEKEVKQTQYNSPTIQIKQADMNVAHAEMNKAKAPMYPKFDLQVNGRTGDNLSGIHGQDTSASALVVMNWNLYRGGGDVARVREAIDRWSQAKEDRMKTQRDVDHDVRQTWAKMVSAGERARQFATQADANVEVVKAYKDQFNLNRRTLLDVLDSQNEEYVSRSNMINAEYIEIFAVYRLLALKGDLMKTLGVSLPREAILADK